MQQPLKQSKLLVLGAGSDMAKPLLHLLFQQRPPSHFYLLARRTQVLTDLAEAGRAKGHTVELVDYDVENPKSLSFSGIETCITYVGWLPPDNNQPEKTMQINYTGIQQFLDQLIAQNTQSLRHILITGSIAGVRVRPANRAYGRAKAALHHYALQLQQQWKGNIVITLVIPGYVQTKMLAETQTPSMLTSLPEDLAEKYSKWLQTKPAVVYSQPVWRGISWVLKLLPQFVINKMKQ